MRNNIRSLNDQRFPGQNLEARNVGRHFRGSRSRGRGSRGRGTRGRGSVRGRGFNRTRLGRSSVGDQIVTQIDEDANRQVFPVTGVSENSEVLEYPVPAEYDSTIAFAIPTSDQGPLPVDLRHMLKQWHSLFATQVGQVLNLRGVTKDHDDG
jgi:hypothetical protein